MNKSMTIAAVIAFTAAALATTLQAFEWVSLPLLVHYATIPAMIRMTHIIDEQYRPRSLASLVWD
jgi:hypothetical protein